MPKLIALISALFLLGSLAGGNAWAAKSDLSVLDRHAVWTKIIKDNKKMIEENKKESNKSSKKEGNESSEKQTEQASTEDHAKIDVRIKDIPWQRVG